MRWNSFTIIGIILIAVGLFGVVKGPTFEFDPGLPNAPYTWLYYILVGVLMIVNGVVGPLQTTSDTDAKADGASGGVKSISK